MKLLIGYVVTSLCAASCAGAPKASEPTPVLSAAYVPGVTADEAVMAITNARCERELRCDNVGTQGTFADRDACARELGRNAQANLRADKCPRGIDEAKLSTCLGVARNERCDDMNDTVSRVIACSGKELCIP